MRSFLNMIIAVIAGLAFGWLSAVGMIETMGLRAVANQPLWKERRLGTEQTFAPYIIGYYLTQGQVPPPQSMREFVRSADDDGAFLRSTCFYVLEGKPLAARWWSISVESNSGMTSTFPASQAVLSSTGTLSLAIAPTPVPGNRITPPEGSSFTLSYAVYDPAPETPEQPMRLPTLKKTGC